MDISIKIENLGAVREVLDRLSGRQAQEAYVKAVNDAAYQVRRAMQKEMRGVFKMPTPYITKSVYVQQATPGNLSATIKPTYYGNSGVDPQKILQAQEFGGQRGDKKFEVALRSAGILPAGYYVAIPGEQYGGPYPGSDDGRGNFRGGFVIKLLAYLNANRETLAAMSKRRRSAITRGFVSYSVMKTRREVKLMDGAELFVLGPGGRPAPGIWSKSGRNGVVFRPVVMFVRRPNYTSRMSMERVAQSVDLQAYLDRRLRFRIREAAGV